MTKLIKIFFTIILLLNTLLCAENEKPVKLVLSAEQTHFIRKKDPFYKKYLPVRARIKVMAIYSDGHREEITDKVEWLGLLKGKIVVRTDYFMAKSGTYTLRASLQGVVSNEITIKVEDDTSLVQHRVIYPDDVGYSRIWLAVTLPYKATQDVHLTLKLRADDKVAFMDGVPKQSYTMIFKPQEWDTLGNTQEVTLEVLDTAMKNSIIVTTEPMISTDSKYSSKNPQDIEIDRKPELVLNAPRLVERKGAVRGASIKFRVTATRRHLKYRLINFPKGVKLIKDPATHLPTGVNLQWDVPMDMEEGKLYPITVEAEDRDGNKAQVNFQIKVPNTTIIPTQIINNELIVVDKSSPLYGMKMKGHNVEDVSYMKLRSVKYEDLWKHYPSQYEANKKLMYTAFIVENKPPELDIDLSDDLYIGFYRYSEEQFVGSNSWKDISRTYTRNPDGTHPPSRNEYDNGGTKVYLVVTEKK